MIQFKRPMLACPLLPANVEHTDEAILAAMQRLRYPVLATLKLDGIRALRLNGSLLSRTLKPIPNRSIRERSLILPGGFDMELWNPTLTYDQIESIVMSHEHPDSDLIQFHVLDWFMDGGYEYRITKIYGLTELGFYRPEPEYVTSAQMLLHGLWMSEQNNGEGICFRTPNSPYKQGRSTLKEQYLVKLCRYIREEVTITGTYEQMYNGNRSSRNAIGAMDRSSSKHNLVGKDTLGGFHVINSKGVSYDVGTGVNLTDKRRRELWLIRDTLVGKKLTVKHKPHGQKDKPRSPVAVGFRTEGF